MIGGSSLPLFQREELSRLQQRRDALLKRVQAMSKYSRGRQEKVGELKAVTAAVIRLENELGRRH
jgi:hypothetical protein